MLLMEGEDLKKKIIVYKSFIKYFKTSGSVYKSEGSPKTEKDSILGKQTGSDSDLWSSIETTLYWVIYPLWELKTYRRLQ